MKSIRCLLKFHRWEGPDYAPARCSRCGEYEGWEPYWWEGIRNRLQSLICRIKGHEWKDEGWAGPNSGCIHLVCQRCGESHRTILY